VSDAIDHYLALAGLPKRTIPIAAERLIAREADLQRQKEARFAETPAASVRAARARQLAEQAAAGQLPAKWGTRAAKRGEIERLKREIAKRQKS
jgi:hypothetical protein